MYHVVNADNHVVFKRWLWQCELEKLTYIFALDELLRQKLNEDFKQAFISDEKLHNLRQRVFIVVGPKLKIKGADDAYS